jgi:hypothetical protein
MSVFPFDLDEKSRAEFRIFTKQLNLPATVEEDVSAQVFHSMAKVTKRLITAPYQDAVYLTMMRGKTPKDLQVPSWHTFIPTVDESPWDEDIDMVCNNVF